MQKFKSETDGQTYELIKNKPITGPRADRLRQMAKLQGIPQDQVDAKLSGEGGTLKLCASDSCDIMSFKTDMELEAKMQELQLVPVSTTKENKMKKTQLIKIIKEELNHVLQSEGFFDSFKMPRAGGHPSKIFKDLEKMGNLQQAFRKYYSRPKYRSNVDEFGSGTVSHYFKRNTPSRILSQAKEYIESAAEGEQQFKNLLKKKDLSFKVNVYTANDLVRLTFGPRGLHQPARFGPPVKPPVEKKPPPPEQYDRPFVDKETAN